ncbi:MAG: UvrD-helicase domain-containing protein [Cellvibrionaceae bacterium]|nr:UvrD-helicase domain-containing protein [Cellvibrionaceae bacterium]
MSNKLIIASAGSGKTQHIVDSAIENVKQGESVLITTYTEACEREIREKLIVVCGGAIPSLITVQTWFSFLIKHGAKPYQLSSISRDIKGMLLVNDKSGLKYVSRAGHKVYWGEQANPGEYYLTSDGKIYSDKLAKFVVRCNDESKGKVIDRISRCFDNIYIDEVQDLAGYDLEVLKALFDCSSKVVLVGDPRQAIYSTNNSAKNKKFKKAEIVNFFSDDKLEIDKDDNSLTVNYRCSEAICDFSNTLYPDMSPATSGNEEVTGHDGIFLVEEKFVDRYLKEFQPVQLRDSKRKKVNEQYPVINFGKSKGLTFKRVLIYPTAPVVKWLKDNSSDLTSIGRSKLYVGLTRARSSIGIVLKRKDIVSIDVGAIYQPDEM